MCNVLPGDHVSKPNPWEPLELPLVRYSFSIIGVCELIHGAYTGTGDPVSDEMLTQLRDWLRLRLADWREELPKCREYDHAVLELAYAAVGEAEAMLKKAPQ